MRDIHGMVLVGASFPDAKAQVAAEVTCEPRMLLKPSPQAPSRPEPARTGRGPPPARCGRLCYQKACAEVTATAATNGKRRRPVTVHGTRTIRANLGYVRPGSGRSVVRPRPDYPLSPHAPT